MSEVKVEVNSHGYAFSYGSISLGTYKDLDPIKISKNIETILTAAIPDQLERQKILAEIANLIETYHSNDKTSKIVVYKCRFTLKDGTHYDEFQDESGALKFISFKNGEILGEISELIQNDKQGNLIILKPMPQLAKKELEGILFQGNEQAGGVNLPHHPIEYNDEKALFMEIRGFVHKWVELKTQLDEVIISLYIMKAALFDFLNVSSFPFIHILGPWGHGKSRLLSTGYAMTPFGLYVVDIKAAALKRISHEYQPILFVDEKGNMDSDLAAILNAKFNSNTLYLNANLDIQNGPSSLVAYKLFGPLVMANRNILNDVAIESKAIQIDFNFEMTRTDIELKIEKEVLVQFLNEATTLRDKLEMFRIRNADKINEIKSNGISKKVIGFITPRLYEVVSTFDDMVALIPGIEETVFEVIKQQVLANVLTASRTLEGEVALTFLKNYENNNLVEYYTNAQKYQGVPLASIYEELGGEKYAGKIGKAIAQLGLTTDRAPIRIKNSEGKQGSIKISIVRISNETKLHELKLKYEIMAVKSKLELLTFDNQDSGTGRTGRTGKIEGVGGSDNGQNEGGLSKLPVLPVLPVQDPSSGLDDLVSELAKRDGKIYVRCKDHMTDDQGKERWFCKDDGEWEMHLQRGHGLESKAEMVLDIFRKLCGPENKEVTVQEVMAEMKKAGIEEAEGATLIASLENSGKIYERSPGRFSLTIS